MTYRREYEPCSMNGERGYEWRLYIGRRLIAAGWSRGRKRDAEADVRRYVDNREASATN